LTSQYGVLAYSSSENSFYHNNFIDNANQAFDDMNNNIWNDTYPSSGNYWSHYSPTCQDLYNGLVTPQTTGSQDGICDFQSNIDGDSIDFYPLKYPFGMPKPPPDYNVTAPTNLKAQLTGANKENVTLTWTLSSDDSAIGTGENDLVAYNIYYNTTYNNSKAGYIFLDSVSSGASSYVHMFRGEGDPNIYFYYVEAEDDNGNMNDTFMQVGKWTRSLNTGRNLISIPLIPSSGNIDSILQTLKFNMAWHYNNTDSLDPWKSFNPSKPYPQTLNTINHTMGLWINVTQDSNLTVAGTVPKSTSIFLKAGWNLVGYPSFTERAVADALVAVSYDRIEGYDSSSPQNLRLYSDTDIMIPGYGYWIKVPFDQFWTVYN
jgi:hypothetical protein